MTQPAQQEQDPASVLQSELQIPQAVIDRYDANERSKGRFERLKLVIEGATLLVVFVYAGITYCLLREAAEANKISTRHFLASNRPWLAIDISVEKPLTFYADRADIVLRGIIRNGGTAPAIRTVFMPNLVIIGTPIDYVLREFEVLKLQKRLCNRDGLRVRLQIQTPTRSGGALVIPNAEIVYVPHGPQSARNDWRPSPSGDVAAWITGCVGYLDGSDGVHATLFTYRYLTSTLTIKTEPGEISGTLALSDIGQDAY